MSSRRGDPATAYIAIGSNLDDPRSQVESAMSLLDALPGCHIVARSSLYQSAPFGGVAQDDFINAVVAVETVVPPAILLSCLKELERARGRDFSEERWGPRILDLDILLYGEEVVDTQELQIPHPGIGERNFVLLPLREIAARLVIPGLGPLANIEISEESPRISKID
ncbi:MAG: 2-amino-4-hydroxy-6-hydroxymethyldihydropteridine diphosphokinase [Woeseiaceae bacterium]